MKKIAMILLMLMALSRVAAAQMAETIGALGMYGTMQREGIQNVATMQNALNRVEFQQDLQELLMRIKMLYGVNFAGISKDAVMFNGFRGIEWDIAGISANKFIVKFSQLNGDLCHVCQDRQWEAEKVLVNDIEANCQSAGNDVQMYFSSY